MINNRSVIHPTNEKELGISLSHHITSHFTWKELLVSYLYPKLAKVINLLNKDMVNFYHLISTTLEPERIVSCTPTHILQGKRSQEMYERLIADGYNPSPTSQHFCSGLFDCAIDFQKITKNTNMDVDIELSRKITKNAFYWIKANCYYSFGQLYYCSPKRDTEIGFIHIGSVTPKHQSKSWIKS